jgi:Arc/MetJ family transcription regulator
MKTLVDIDEVLLREAMALAGSPTKKETVRQALTEFIRAQRRQSLKKLAGSGVLTMTMRELVDARRRPAKLSPRLTVRRRRTRAR